MKKHINIIIKELQERGRFKTPEEVDKFFEKKLWEVSMETLKIIAYCEGWEESEEHYKKILTK